MADSHPTSTRRAALLAPAALAAVPAAVAASPLIGHAEAAIAAERHAQYMLKTRCATLADEKRNLDWCNALSGRAWDLVSELAEMQARNLPELMAKARAFYQFADKDEAGALLAADSAEALAFSIVEDLLALAGEPVPG